MYSNRVESLEEGLMFGTHREQGRVRCLLAGVQSENMKLAFPKDTLQFC